jgi:hypothetical protein
MNQTVSGSKCIISNIGRSGTRRQIGNAVSSDGPSATREHSGNVDPFAFLGAGNIMQQQESAFQQQ